MADQTAYSSAQLKSGNDQMWYYGGNQLGPAPATNPIRQWLGNTVEAIGDIIPGGEGYISEYIAGGPTKHTGYAYASENPTGDTGLIGPLPNPNPSPTPTPTPTPAPAQQNVDYMQFYQGWDPNQAYQDFQNAFGGDINRLMTARGVNTGGSSGPNMEEIRQQQLALINDRYNQNEGLLNQQEQNLRDVYPQQEQEINDSYNLASQRASNTFDTTNNSLKNQEIRTRQDQEKMLDSARRLYNELLMGSKQRFGGASGAGEFAKAILGSEFQRTMGANRQTAYDQLSQINQKRIDFEKEYQYSNQQLELEKASAIRELGYSFKDKLFQIQSDRSKNLQMKQAEEFESLKSYASELQAVNARAQELQQSLILQKDKMETQFQYELALMNSKAQNASKYESPNWKVSQYENTPFFYNSKGQVQAINPNTVGVVKDEEEEEKGFLDWLK